MLKNTCYVKEKTEITTHEILAVNNDEIVRVADLIAGGVKYFEAINHERNTVQAIHRDILMVFFSRELGYTYLCRVCKMERSFTKPGKLPQLFEAEF